MDNPHTTVVISGAIFVVKPSADFCIFSGYDGEFSRIMAGVCLALRRWNVHSIFLRHFIYIPLMAIPVTPYWQFGDAYRIGFFRQ